MNFIFDDFCVIDFYDDEFPHAGVVTFIEKSISYLNNSNNKENFWVNFNKKMHALFGEESSGYGFDWVGTIFSYYDDEFMHEYGIPYFEKNSAFIVLMEEES